MSDFELVENMFLYINYLEQLVERFTTFLFAFLVASHLASKKLQTSMVALVLTLYVYMLGRYALLYANVGTDAIALAAQLNAMRVQGDFSASWMSISPTFPTVVYTQVIAMVAGMVASLVFFFYSRYRASD